MLTHNVQAVPDPLNPESTVPRSQRVLRRLSTIAIVVAALAGAGGLTYAAVIWSFDELITPRGWIVVGCTTTCALGVFIGAVGFMQARNRELQAAADRQRHQDTDRITHAVATLEDLHRMVEPLGRVAAVVEQQTQLLQTVERNSAQRTRIMRQLAERMTGAVSANHERLTSLEGAVGALPQVVHAAARGAAVDVLERVEDLERDVASVRVREAQREQEHRGGVSRIRPRPDRDR